MCFASAVRLRHQQRAKTVEREEARHGPFWQPDDLEEHESEEDVAAVEDERVARLQRDRQDPTHDGRETAVRATEKEPESRDAVHAKEDAEKEEGGRGEVEGEPEGMEKVLEDKRTRKDAVV